MGHMLHLMGSDGKCCSFRTDPGRSLKGNAWIIGAILIFSVFTGLALVGVKIALSGNRPAVFGALRRCLARHPHLTGYSHLSGCVCLFGHPCLSGKLNIAGGHGRGMISAAKGGGGIQGQIVKGEGYIHKIFLHIEDISAGCCMDCEKVILQQPVNNLC